MGKSKLRKPSSVESGSGSSSSSTTYYLVAALALVLAVAAALYLSPSSAPVVPAPDFSQNANAAAKPRKNARAPAANAPSKMCEEGAENYMCQAWHKAGMCRRADVRAKCARTCGQCSGVPPRNPPVTREDRCQRDNLTAAVSQGQLTPLFERILSSYPQYEPEALSTSPYVLLLKNFLSESEAAAFLRVCQKSFERSLAGDQLNPVRTSYQCWCNFHECFTDPDVHRVTSRINDVLGIPYDNGEDLQIVRYEEGQFYRRHHDQNTAVWTPQGPRVLTFFMYLNEPEAGGETAFPKLGPHPGLRVAPKLGHAILWPSTLDERPMEADMRTDHEAMTVHKGIKYAANMWIHQFSFKTPSERGCELTYVNTVGSRPGSPEHAALVGNGRVPTAAETARLASRPSGSSAGASGAAPYGELKPESGLGR